MEPWLQRELRDLSSGPSVCWDSKGSCTAVDIATECWSRGSLMTHVVEVAGWGGAAPSATSMGLGCLQSSPLYGCICKLFIYRCSDNLCHVATNTAYMNCNLKVSLRCKVGSCLRVACPVGSLLSWEPHDFIKEKPSASPCLSSHSMIFQAASASLRLCIICRKAVPRTGDGPRVSLSFSLMQLPLRSKYAHSGTVRGPACPRA